MPFILLPVSLSSLAEVSHPHLCVFIELAPLTLPSPPLVLSCLGPDEFGWYGVMVIECLGLVRFWSCRACLGLLVSWSIRVRVWRCLGLLVSWSFGVLVFWSLGSLVSFSLRVYFISRLQLSCPCAFGVFILRSCLNLVSWSFRVLVVWCFGLLQSCSLGVLACYFLGPYVLCSLVLLVFWYLVIQLDFF